MKNTMLSALSLADAAWLSRTIDRNKAVYGGWRMDASGTGGDDNGSDDGGSGGAGGDGGEFDKNFPEKTPIGAMSQEQQLAYWKWYAQQHETRNKDLLKITGGKYGEDLKAEMDALEKLRDKDRTDGEKAVEAAKRSGRTEGAAGAVRLALELALGHDPEKNNLSTLIDALDLTKVLTDDGQVDADKVRALVKQIAPAGKGTGTGNERRTDTDYGAGRREHRSGKTGMAAGADLYASRHKKSATN